MRWCHGCKFAIGVEVVSLVATRVVNEVVWTHSLRISGRRRSRERGYDRKLAI